jgi:hypothetical protein
MTASNFTTMRRSPPAAPSRLPTVLLAGPWELPEFAIARSPLPPIGDVAMAPTLDMAIEQVAASVTPPDLLLVAAPRPGLVTPEHVERLGAVAPLARLVIVAGSWCEGEWRTGRPPLGAVRLYWYELGAWWRAALAALADGAAPPWSGPLDEPRAGQAAARRLTHVLGESRGLIAVDAIDFETFETLAAGLSWFGWQCAWRPRGRLVAPDDDAKSFAGGVWDGGQLDGRELESLRCFCDWLKPRRAPTVALIDYPRAEHASAIAGAGAAAMAGKPYRADWLADELARLVRISSLP